MVHGRDEIFPFASWSLFTLVPNDVRDYTVHVTEIGGETVDPPLPFERSKRHFAEADSHGARISIQRLGRALERDEAAEVERVRAYFERLYLNGGGVSGAVVHYDVVSRRYDPLERWRDGTFRESRILARFQTTPLQTADTHEAEAKP